ncbi:putative protein phosphatase 2C 80 [Smittium mucronatum]|uniref:Protein phosphatase n=1 Tax=Smittium mucronatum TaxID=133383 RepID=A0A1R0H0F2_9FUNG|nr:putative protein phosphatase 2C 80 [Smittium mucronatum]
MSNLFQVGVPLVRGLTTRNSKSSFRCIYSQANIKGGKQTKYSFLVGAYGIPKNKKDSSGQYEPFNGYPKPLKFDNSESSWNVGEDAFFFRKDAIGLGDGIGGWSTKKNSSSALFSKRLMYNTCHEIGHFKDGEDDAEDSEIEISSSSVLKDAFISTLRDMKKAKLKGSSTACVALLRGDELQVTNIGDSGLTIIRDGELIFRTEEQQHSFNYPYQLGTEENSDDVSNAQTFRIKVKKNDLIILASDGLYDNLFDEDILEEIENVLDPDHEGKILNPGQSLDKKKSSVKLGVQDDEAKPLFLLKSIASVLARRAYKVSLDPDCTQSPFQFHAIYEGLYYHGGKHDDITVVVALITDN